MPDQNSFHDYLIQDLMQDIAGISSRAMFGGYGIYKEGIIFGLIADDELYFKADPLIEPYFIKAGSSPFTYNRKNHPRTVMSYWKVPADVMEDRSELAIWVDRSVAASRRMKNNKS